MFHGRIKQIKVPKTIKIIYCYKKNILVITGPKGEKIIKPTLKVFLSPEADKIPAINITLIPHRKLPNNMVKRVKEMQGQTAALIKNTLLEVSQLMYKRLNLVGVGYRILMNDEKICTNFTLKLGFSHLIYYNLPDALTVHSTKYNKLTLFGLSGTTLSQTTATLRSLKKPEPYKGKGILYQSEKVHLKVGKRV